ncbi:MAG: phage baseplate assembly protein V [Maricaulis sp.]|nr:phage baseplate assembly protein V [Maricaulis sp.]
MPTSNSTIGSSTSMLVVCLLATPLLTNPLLSAPAHARQMTPSVTSQAAQDLPFCRRAEPGERCRTRNGEIRTRSENRPQGNRAERRARRANDAANQSNIARPEVDDEVLVEFENGDPRQPVIIGRGGQEAHPEPTAEGFVEDRTFDSQIRVGDELPSGVRQGRSATLPHVDGRKAEETDEFGGEDIGFARQPFGGQDLGGRQTGEAPVATHMESEFSDEDSDEPQEPQLPTGGGTSTTTTSGSDPDPDPEDCEYRNPAGGPDQDFCDE